MKLFKLLSTVPLLFLLSLGGCASVGTPDPLITQDQGEITVGIVNVFSNDLSFDGHAKNVDWDISLKVEKSVEKLLRQLPSIAIKQIEITHEERKGISSFFDHVPENKRAKNNIREYLERETSIGPRANNQKIDYLVFITSYADLSIGDNINRAAGSGLIIWHPPGVLEVYSALSIYIFDPGSNKFVYGKSFIDRQNNLQVVWDMTENDFYELKKDIKEEIIEEGTLKGNSLDIELEVKDRAKFLCAEVLDFENYSEANREILLNDIEESVNQNIKQLYESYGLEVDFRVRQKKSPTNILGEVRRIPVCRTPAKEF